MECGGTSMVSGTSTIMACGGSRRFGGSAGKKLLDGCSTSEHCSEHWSELHSASPASGQHNSGSAGRLEPEKAVCL